jgi:hypothetical protein
MDIAVTIMSGPTLMAELALVLLLSIDSGIWPSPSA